MRIRPVLAWLIGWPWRLVRATLALPFRLLRSPLFWAALFLMLLVVLVTYYGLANRYTPCTTDAYVQAFVVQVAPRVAGEVVSVAVTENQQVAKGDLLFTIDPRPFEHKVRQLRAAVELAIKQVEQMNSELQAARAEEDRLAADSELARTIHDQEQMIFKQGSTTERKYFDARQKFEAARALVTRSRAVVREKEQALAARIGDEHALIAEARAKLAEAELDLAWTKIYAPARGTITDLQLRVGSYTTPGKAVMTVIETERWWVVANFRENTLEHIRAGQPAGVVFKCYPGRILPGTVECVGPGIRHGQGIPSGDLPEVDVPESWISKSQRFQVRITMNAAGAVPLRVGATASVTVYTSEDNPLNPIARWWQDVESWLFYLR